MFNYIFYYFYILFFLENDILRMWTCLVTIVPANITLVLSSLAVHVILYSPGMHACTLIVYVTLIFSIYCIASKGEMNSGVKHILSEFHVFIGIHLPICVLPLLVLSLLSGGLARIETGVWVHDHGYAPDFEFQFSLLSGEPARVDTGVWDHDSRHAQDFLF